MKTYDTLTPHPEPAELVTLLDFMRYALSCFNQVGLHYGHGTAEAWDEAVALVLSAVCLPLNTGPELWQSRLTLSERNKILHWIKLRVDRRKPLAYISQEAWFAGLKFYVDERVLVPRSPLAELIEKGFEPWLQQEPLKILDLCTGSGCIAIACAYAFPDAEIDSVDISAEALDVAATNIKMHEVGEQVHLIQSDLFTALAGQRYDLIVSNPPYVPVSSMQGLPAEYKHEPTLGLVSGEDGLSITHEILASAPSHLTATGTLVVEVGESQAALEQTRHDLAFTWLDFERGGEGIFVLTDYSDLH